MPAVRRLAAILSADVAGYSRLTGADEGGTHRRLRAHFADQFQRMQDLQRRQMEDFQDQAIRQQEQWTDGSGNKKIGITISRTDASWVGYSVSLELY